MNPDPKHVYQAFCESYRQTHGNLIGVKDAFEWWLDPKQQCQMQIAPTHKQETKCKKICPMCRAIRQKDLEDAQRGL